MSETTLGHIATATEETLVEHESIFNIVKIDTTNLGTKEGAMLIAQKTLKALGDFLDESVCVVDASSISLPEQGYIEDKTLLNAFLSTVDSERKFVRRSEAETNAAYLQPIPMAILEYGDEILLLKRNKPGHALHDKYDVWSGGHVNKGDDGPTILINALNREITEEVFIKDAYELDPTPIALLRTNETARASLHVGVLFRLKLKSNDVALSMNQKEFRATRGSSMSGRLIKTQDLGSVYQEMGDWSKFVSRSLWPDAVPQATNAAPLFGIV